MSFTVPPGYSKLEPERRYDIIQQGINRFGVVSVFSDFSKITSQRVDTAWGHIYLADLDEIIKALPVIKCPAGTIFNRSKNKCVPNTPGNRLDIAEKARLLSQSPVRLQSVYDEVQLFSGSETGESDHAIPTTPPLKATSAFLSSSSSSSQDWKLDLKTVMTAQDAPKDLNRLQYPIYASVKYDGHFTIRARGTVLSRSLIPLPNVAIRNCLTNLLPEGFIFELVINNNLNEAQSWLRSLNKGIPEKLDVVVFDWIQQNTINSSEPFERRYKNIVKWGEDNAEIIRRLRDRTSPMVECVNIHIHTKTHSLVTSAEDMKKLAELALSEGEEGLVLRPLTGVYTQARSNGMLKIKDYQDTEGRIDGFNVDARGDIQSIQVTWYVPRTNEKVVFNISSGLNIHIRDVYEEYKDKLIGQYLKFSYQGKPNSSTPRHSTIIGIRFTDDMDPEVVRQFNEDLVNPRALLKRKRKRDI